MESFNRVTGFKADRRTTAAQTTSPTASGANATPLLNFMDAANGESWLRVYYNEAGTDAAPEDIWLTV